MDTKEIGRRLAEPFPLNKLGFKPQATNGNRALPVAYIDARDVMDRLDEVVGTENWQDSYDQLPGGQWLCRLSVRFGDEWITKQDVGGESDQADKGDKCKAAVSDAIKRAAVKFGIGRYLYALELQWCDFDPVKKKFTQTPVVPASFLPALDRNKAPAPKSQPAPAPPAPPAPVQQPKAASEPTKPAAAPPANGVELLRRLREFEAKLVEQKLCKPSELVNHIVVIGTKAGYATDLSQWPGPAIQLAVSAVREFDQRARAAADGKPAGALFDNTKPAGVPH